MASSQHVLAIFDVINLAKVHQNADAAQIHKNLCIYVCMCEYVCVCRANVGSNKGAKYLEIAEYAGYKGHKVTTVRQMSLVAGQKLQQQQQQLMHLLPPEADAIF